MRTARRWERYAPLTGVLAVVLWVVGFVILATSGVFGPGTSPEQVLAAYQKNSGTVLIGSYIFELGALFLIWFLGSLRGSLRAAEGGVGRVASIAFGGGLAMAVCVLLVPAGGMAIALNAGTIRATVADVLNSLPGVFFIGTELFAAVLVGATGLVALRTAVLPRWLAWLSFVLALVLLIPPIGWLGVMLGTPVWIVMVSLLLVRSAAASTASLIEGVG